MSISRPDRSRQEKELRKRKKTLHGRTPEDIGRGTGETMKEFREKLNAGMKLRGMQSGTAALRRKYQGSAEQALAMRRKIERQGNG